jgi:hypothetical protein
MKKFDEGIKGALDSLLLHIPGVVAGKMFGYPAYYKGKKLFACVYEDGVGIKVPEDLAGKLTKTEGITYFQPLGRAKMKQWIQIKRQDPRDYLKDLETFQISIDHVAKGK